MRKNICGIAIFFIIAFAACAQQKPVVQGSSAATAQKGEGYSYISMRRTPCFGKCPTYEIELYKGGLVKYTGLSETKYTGTYEKNMKPEVVDEIFAAFEQHRVDTCSEEYPMLIPDLPGIRYKLVFNGTEKEIRNAQFGPEFLQSLTTKIDNRIGEPGSGWREVREQEEEKK